MEKITCVKKEAKIDKDYAVKARRRLKAKRGIWWKEESLQLLKLEK
jgi:hypothetical protein